MKGRLKKDVLLRNLIFESIRALNEWGEDGLSISTSGVNPHSTSNNYAGSNVVDPESAASYQNVNSCQVSRIEDAFKNDIRGINLGIQSWIENEISRTLENVESSWKTDLIKSSIKGELFSDTVAGDEVWKNYTISMKEFLKEYIDTFSFGVENSADGGGPCKNVSFYLDIPYVKNKNQASFLSDQFKRSITSVVNKEIDISIKKIGRLFDESTDSLLKAIKDQRFIEYIDKNLFNRHSMHGIIADLLTGGAFSTYYSKEDLKSVGIVGKEADNWKEIMTIDLIDYWLSILMFLVSRKDGKSSAGPESSTTIMKTFWSISFRFVSMGVPTLLLLALAQKGVNVIEESILAERVVKTCNSAMKKALEKSLQSMKSKSENIIDNLMSPTIDLNAIFNDLDLDVQVGGVKSEIRKTLDKPIEDLDQGLNTFEAFLLSNPINQWSILNVNPRPDKSVSDTIYDSILLALTNYDKKYNRGIDLEAEAREMSDRYEKAYQEAQAQYQKEKEIQEKLNNINSRYNYETGGELEAEQYLSLQAALKNLDHNEWYRKRSDVKQGEVFSPREAQLLNDVFKMTDVNVNQKESESKYFNALDHLGYSTNSIKLLACTIAARIVINLSLAIQKGPAVLNSINEKSSEVLVGNGPMDFIDEISEKYDFGNTSISDLSFENKRIYLKLKKSKYLSMIRKWNINDPEPGEYENTSNQNKFMFPFDIRFIEKRGKNEK